MKRLLFLLSVIFLSSLFVNMQIGLESEHYSNYKFIDFDKTFEEDNGDDNDDSFTANPLTQYLPFFVPDSSISPLLIHTADFSYSFQSIRAPPF